MCAKISVDRRKRRLEKQQVLLANSLPPNERSQRRLIGRREPRGGSLQMLSRAERLCQILGKINAQPMGFNISAPPSETLQI